MPETLNAAERSTFCTPLAALRMLRLRVVEWAILPEAPEIVTVVVPFAAVFATAKTTTADPAAPDELKLALTPEGSPDAARTTLPLNPFKAAALTSAVPLVPGSMPSAPGAIEIEKSGGATTDTARVAELLRLPELPVILTLAVPVAADAPAVRVMTTAPLADAAPNAAVTPAGSPDALRLTLPVNPP